MKFDLSKKVVDFLKENSGQKFTAFELGEFVFSRYPNECRDKGVRSKNKFITGAQTVQEKDSAIINALRAEIGSQRPNIIKKEPNVKTTEGRPRKYYYTEKTDFDEVAVIEREEIWNSQAQEKLSEKHLYPKLSEFLWTESKIFSKRIDERRSTNSNGKGGNQWLYPDVVAMENLSADWKEEIKKCVKQYADKKTHLWSFEVKLLINRSNIRQCFFQTVSNSSWANFAYLVAAELEGVDTIKELRLLGSLHGIGFIKLNVENPAESEILIPAQERLEVDWDNVNRLASESQDFMNYITTIREFYQTDNIKLSDWDLPDDTD